MTDRRWLLGIAAAWTLVVLGASAFGPYGYFIDELYYLSCARHLALGYVDHPPLAPLLLAGVRATLGESLVAIRLLPALVGGATIVCAGLLARAWGGGRFAMCLAALCTAVAPFMMIIGGYYSMNVLELLDWVVLLLLATRLVQRPFDPGLSTWLAIGAAIGLGFLAKHTVVLVTGGLACGLALTPVRASLRTRGPWLGAALALAIAAPHLVWEVRHGWPTLEFYRQATALKNIRTSPGGVLLGQVMVLGVLSVPVAGVGAVALLWSARLRPFRFAGVAWWLLLGLLMLARSSRPDRIAGLAVALFAAGAVTWEAWLRAPAARAALAGLVLLGGVAFAPLGLPLLPYDAAAAYAARAHVTPKIERGHSAPLPQWLADRTGWESFLRDMRRVVRTLSPAERAHARIYVPDYGHFGALELRGPRHGLPPPIAPHNSTYHWSVGHTDSDVLVAVDLGPRMLRRLFRDVRDAGVVTCDFCPSWRANMPVFVAKGPIRPLSEVWPSFRHYE